MQISESLVPYGVCRVFVRGLGKKGKCIFARVLAQLSRLERGELVS